MSCAKIFSGKPGQTKSQIATLAMGIKAQQLEMYFLLLALSLVVFVIALGPGLFNSASVGILSWQHEAFHLLCHQNSDRSYFIGGAKMAVCSRCIGIYSSFLLGVLIMPLIPRFFLVINRKILQLIIVAIVINFLDVLGNGIGIWTNTLHSRFFLGAFFGLSLALILTSEFFKQINTKEKVYGK